MESAQEKRTTRRVTAQRKFAQGAYVPPVMTATPSTSGVANATTVRRDAPAATHENTNTVFHHTMSAHHLLDVVCFQGKTSSHVHLQPIVLVERLPEKNNHNETLVNGKNPTPKVRKKVRVTANKCKRAPPTKHLMKLRTRDQRELCYCEKREVLPKVSKLLVPQQPKRATTQLKRVVTHSKRFIPKSKRVVHQRKLPKKTTSVSKRVPPSSAMKRICSRRLTDACSEFSDFSLDDNRPLTFFAKSSTPKTSDVPIIMGPPTKLPPLTRFAKIDKFSHPPCEPSAVKVGGNQVMSVSPVPSSSNIAHSIVNSYYGANSIYNWMLNGSQEQGISPQPQNDIVDALNNNEEPEQACSSRSLDTPLGCPAILWDTVKDVVVAPKHRFDSRCQMCEPCKGIKQIMEISTILKQHKKIHYFDETNVQLGETSTNNKVIIIDLLPPHQHLMIKINIQTNPKGYFSCLVPTPLRTNSDKFKLADNEELLKQVLIDLNLSCGRPPPSFDDEQPSSSGNQLKERGYMKSKTDEIEVDDGELINAPVYYPTKEDFTDPIKYINSIWDKASIYGICKICPPPGFVPPCKADDDIRFEVFNQYISRLYNRWGPAIKQMCAIKASVQAQSMEYNKPIMLEGVELNVPKLYNVVQSLGGLEVVFNDQKWGKVSDEMNLNTNPFTIRKLERIYTKYILPYDTLSPEETQDFLKKAEYAWQKKHKKLLKHANNPFHVQNCLLGDSESSADESDGNQEPHDAEDCIKPGSNMNLAQFKKIASITFDNFFRNRAVSTKEIENEYWQIVLDGKDHVCVNSAFIDTAKLGLGFTSNSSDVYGAHPWNLKMFSQNPCNVLRSLGPALGVTVPTLHLGMVFSTSCWHRDPHSIPWIEYLHQGPIKIWYGIPESQENKFREVTDLVHPTACLKKSLWLPSDISMVPPTVLRKHGVKVCRVEQKPGEFILVMPRAYSSSICTGYTVSESTYFATERWLDNVIPVFTEIKKSCEPTMFTLEQLLQSIAKDPRTPVSLLSKIETDFKNVFFSEIYNRSVLNSEGIKRSEPPGTSPPPAVWNVRDLDECEICRCTLYLSKVKNIPSMNSTVCPEHAILLLSNKKYAMINKADVELIEIHPTDELLSLMRKLTDRIKTSQNELS